MGRGISKKRMEMGEEKWDEYQKERKLQKSLRWIKDNKETKKHFLFIEGEIGRRKIKDITGTRSGMLVAIKPVKRDEVRKQIIWECKCDCGKYSTVPSYKISGGETKSCGCQKSGGFVKRGYAIKNAAKPNEFVGSIAMTYFNRLKRSALRRNINFGITPDYVNELFEEQGRCCSLSGASLFFYTGARASETTASLDRIDNSKGYEIGNVWWVHKFINILRGNYNLSDFVKICKLGETITKNLRKSDKFKAILDDEYGALNMKCF